MLPDAIKGGVNHSNFSLEMKKAENHTYCMVRVIDNGNELLHVKTAAFGFQAPLRGGAQPQLLDGNEKG